MSSSSSPPKGTDLSPLASFISSKTPGVKNIEAAYRRGGASSNHTPGHGSALKEGEEQQQGVGSKKFEREIGDQRQEPSMIGKMFNNMINGTDHTK